MVLLNPGMNLSKDTPVCGASLLKLIPGLSNAKKIAKNLVLG